MSRVGASATVEAVLLPSVADTPARSAPPLLQQRRSASPAIGGVAPTAVRAEAAPDAEGAAGAVGVVGAAAARAVAEAGAAGAAAEVAEEEQLEPAAAAAASRQVSASWGSATHPRAAERGGGTLALGVRPRRAEWVHLNGRALQEFGMFSTTEAPTLLVRGGGRR